MKAIVQEGYGSPDRLVLRDVAEPAIGNDEVLVRVRAASLHPDVWHMVMGRPYVLRLMGGGWFKPKHPIPGTDMSGIVHSIGKDVTRFEPGDEVFGETMSGHQWVNGGAFAEFVSVRQEWLASKPRNVSFEQAASVPTSGFIALSNLRDASRFGAGKNVLINGAGGGVGTIALQFIKAHGATVTAVDTTNKLPMLKTLGADEVIDYTKQDFTRLGARYDFIFDVPGNRPFSVCRKALNPDGKYVPIGHDHFGESGRRVFGLIPHFLKLMLLSRFVKQLGGSGVPLPDRATTLATLREYLESGKLTPLIDRTYSFDQIGAAFHRMTHEGPMGKVMLVNHEGIQQPPQFIGGNERNATR